MVALAATRDNPLIREIYLKHTERGMEKMAAIGLCMHKILRIIYGMLKHHRPFDPEIDRRNQSRVLNNRPDRPDKSRRFQTFDSKAPISSRQSKKRKERNKSQSSRHTPQIQDGIIVTVPPINLPHQSLSVQEVS